MRAKETFEREKIKVCYQTIVETKKMHKWVAMDYSDVVVHIFYPKENRRSVFII